MGEIRHGALEGLVLEAVAKASSLPAKMLRQPHMFAGNIGEVAEAALEKGAVGLDRFGPKLFHPISPMLANPADNEQEALTRLGEASWEYKLDGARIQVHKAGDQIKTFKGLADEMLHWMTQKLLKLETHRDNYTVYVKPELVIEIAYSDLQESTRYSGGLALRFARVKGFREDKSPNEADTIQTVWSIFEETTR